MDSTATRSEMFSKTVKPRSPRAITTPVLPRLALEANPSFLSSFLFLFFLFFFFFFIFVAFLPHFPLGMIGACRYGNASIAGSVCSASDRSLVGNRLKAFRRADRAGNPTREKEEIIIP